MLYSFEEWGQLYISSSDTSLLRRKCFLVLFVFGILLPFLLHILSTTSDRQKSAIKENLSVAYPVQVNKEGLLKRKSLLQSQVPERFPKFWCFVFWEVCGGNDGEGNGIFFWWLGFVLSVWFSLMGEKGTFKGWLEGRSRLWRGVAIWQGEQVLQFSTFSLGKENCFP